VAALNGEPPPTRHPNVVGVLNDEDEAAILRREAALATEAEAQVRLEATAQEEVWFGGVKDYGVIGCVGVLELLTICVCAQVTDVGLNTWMFCQRVWVSSLYMHRRGEERRLGFKVHFSYQITSEIANAHHHNSFTMLQVLEAAAREEIAKINSESNEEDNGGGHAKNDDDDDDDDDEDDDGSRGVASAATLKAEAEVLEKEAKVRERRSVCNTISEQDQLHLRFCSVFILALPSPFSSSTLSCSPISLPFFLFQHTSVLFYSLFYSMLLDSRCYPSTPRILTLLH
jgi:hypothetical protein